MNAPPEAKAYVRNLRNPLKRAYAQSYLLWLCQEGRDFKTGLLRPAPGSGSLPYMAAQAVRLELGQMMPESGALK